MKKRIKRYIALLLSLTLLFSGVLPVSAQNTKSYATGLLNVFTDSGEEKQVKAVLYDEELILLEPETIADIAGVNLAVEKDDYTFRRGNYVVQVNAKTKEVNIGVAVDEAHRNYFDRMQNRDAENPFAESEEYVAAWKLYPKEKFRLEEIQKLKADGREKVFFPLEKMFYLLNVQWTCHEEDMRVYCYSPMETLWNVMGEYRIQEEYKPSSYEVIGSSFGEQISNATRFGLLAVGDELKPWMLVPWLNEEWLGDEDLEQALLTLSTPCENIMDSMKADLEQAAQDYVGDLAGFVGKAASTTGVTNVTNFIGKDFTKWTDYIEVPEGIEKAQIVKLVTTMVNSGAAAARYLDWTEGYKQELKDLSKIEVEGYDSYCEQLNKVAKSLYNECDNWLDTFAVNTIQDVIDFEIDLLLGITPVGWALAVYEGTTAVFSMFSPKVRRAFSSAEYATDAMRLCDLSCLLCDKYGEVIEEKKGQPEKEEDLKEIRKWGEYLASASAHGYDSLYSALKMILINEIEAEKEARNKEESEKIFGGKKEIPVTVTDSEIRASSIMGKDMDELVSKMILNQTFVLRFQETEQYDRLLMINDSFDNLHSDEEGAHREKIPPEYVWILENNGGNVVRCGKDYYYWKYNAESFAADGLFGYYSYMPDTVNQLICRHSNGEEEVLLKSMGFGPIYIVNDRIYLSKDNELFSVKLDGSDRIDHGLFDIWTADEESGTILGISYEWNEDGFMRDRGGIYALNSSDYQITQVKTLGSNYSFIKEMDGYAYFNDIDYDAGWTALYRISLDGSEFTELDRIPHTDDLFYTPSIVEVTLLDDRIYYCYGGYAGTGGFFQTGGINSVKADGSDKKTYVGDGEIAAEEFLVEEKDEEILLYYIGPGDEVGSYIGYWDDYPYKNGCDVMNLTTGETKQSDFKLSKMGSYVCMDGEISMIQEHSPTYDLVIPKEAAKKFNFIDQPTDTDKEINLISRLDVVGDELFFTVEKSIRNRERDFGWRPGYDRGGSTFYTMKIGDTKARELYSY